MTTERVRQISSVRKQHLLVEFASLKYAGLQGIYMSITPGNPRLWPGVIFIRKGPYDSATLRFDVFFPPAYPVRPPSITFTTEIFHPLVAPSTTRTHITGSSDNGIGSPADEYSLPPGGFSLKHGFPRWFVGSEHRETESTKASVASTEPPDDPLRSELVDGQRWGALSSTSAVQVVDVLRYMRSAFDTEEVLDSIPLTAAGNSSAWHAWQAHRGKDGAGKSSRSMGFRRGEGNGERNGVQETGSGDHRLAAGPSARRGRSAADWNWEGVWEERVRRGIMNSNADSVLYRNSGGNDYDLIHFLNMEPEMLATVEEEIMSSARMESSE